MAGIWAWWTGEAVGSRVDGKAPMELKAEGTGWRIGEKRRFSECYKAIQAVQHKAVELTNQRGRVGVTEMEAAQALDAELSEDDTTAVKKLGIYDFVVNHKCTLPQ